MNRIIAHLDMDAFFASVEERYNPQFRGLPLVVGSEPKAGRGRGVVSTANYKAREYGIHSALPITKAWEISQKMKSQGKPEVIFLPVDFGLYGKSSENIFRIIKKYSDKVEQASIDEFYFDLTITKTFKKAENICKKIKDEIRKEEKITCSIGIGPSKLISKIAAGIKKPDGMLVVLPLEAEKFLEPLPIRKIPGIGPKTEEVFNQKGIKIVKELKKLSKSQLHGLLGKWGDDLYYKVRGVDESEIILEREVKSIGEQTTFDVDIISALFIGEELSKMCHSVFDKFKESGFDEFKTVAITVRFSDFDTKTSAKSFKKESGANDFGNFNLEALKLMLPYLDKRKNPKLKKIRLIGVRVENLSKIFQQRLGSI